MKNCMLRSLSQNLHLRKGVKYFLKSQYLFAKKLFLAFTISYYYFLLYVSFWTTLFLNKVVQKLIYNKVLQISAKCGNTVQKYYSKFAFCWNILIKSFQRCMNLWKRSKLVGVSKQVFIISERLKSTMPKNSMYIKSFSRVLENFLINFNKYNINLI